MTISILIMGLSGTGKTMLAAELMTQLYNAGHTSTWLNGDDVRRAANDWDFTAEGRLRQATRMKDLSADVATDFVIYDFIAPLPEMRGTVDANWVVWMDTEKSSEFKDTDSIFVPPTNWDFRVTEKDSKKWAASIALAITSATVS